jgi:membrane protease YdiL (CAAX protease family)
MLSPKPWRAEAVVRLILGVIVCAYAGSLAVSAGHAAAGKSAARFFPVAAAAWGLLGTTLVLLRRRWEIENLRRRPLWVLGCFYGGLLLGAWAQAIAGPPPVRGTAAQMIVSTLSFQGATLVLLGCFLRDHESRWDVFGFSHHWRRALLVGVAVGCLALPIGWSLQEFSALVIRHLSHHAKPAEQLSVQILRQSFSWRDQLALGAVTIGLVPVAEETLFRGVLYPAIKQAGFPRAAFWGSALLFAVIHMHLPSLAPLFILALVLTVLYEQTDNLLAPIAAHSLFNALNFAALCWIRDRAG